jgi:hypothetical protein
MPTATNWTHHLIAQTRRKGKEHIAASTKVYMTTGGTTHYEHSNDRADKYWPHHLDITLPTKKGKEQAEAITVYTAIPDMAESLKAIMHRRRKTGMSDTTTAYIL